jgi:hypothetical protein
MLYSSIHIDHIINPVTLYSDINNVHDYTENPLEAIGSGSAWTFYGAAHFAPCR